MKEHEVRERAFATPLTSPAYPPGPYRFVNREYLIITAALAAPSFLLKIMRLKNRVALSDSQIGE